MGNKTPLFARRQAGGVITFVDERLASGDIYWVNSATGTDAAGYGENPDSPVATLDYAIGLCTAGQGDLIVLMPGHAETTTAIALDVAGVRIVGQGYGQNRPTLTATTAASDLIAVTAANCEIENVRLVGAASGNTALLDLSAAATDFVARRCEFSQAATPLNGVTISADRFVFEDCQWIGTANGPDFAIALEAHLEDWRISRCRFLFGAFGLDAGVIGSAADAQIGYVIEDVVAVGLDTLLVNFASSSAAPPDGLFASGRVMASAALTSIEDLVGTAKGMAFGTVYATDAAGKRGGQIPLTSAS